MIKILMNYPPDLLSKIDKFAKKKELTRSAAIRRLVEVAFKSMKKRKVK